MAHGTAIEEFLAIDPHLEDRLARSCCLIDADDSGESGVAAIKGEHHLGSRMHAQSVWELLAGDVQRFVRP